MMPNRKNSSYFGAPDPPTEKKTCTAVKAYILRIGTMPTSVKSTTESLYVHRKCSALAMQSQPSQQWNSGPIPRIYYCSLRHRRPILRLKGCSAMPENRDWNRHTLFHYGFRLFRFFSTVEKVTLKQPCSFHADFNHDFRHSGTPL